MKRILQKTLQTTPKIWAMIIVVSVILSLLYTIFSIIGISKSTSFYITLSLAFVLAILGLLLFPKSLLTLRTDDEASKQKLPAENQKLGDRKKQSTKISSPTDAKQKLQVARRMPQQPVEIFISYSHKDQALANQLMLHLRPLEREARVTVWSDKSIRPGTNWEEEIVKHLRTSQIILILVSPNLFASHYYKDFELKLAIERYRSGEVTIIPVILRPVSWKETPLHELNPLPANGEPVESSSWHGIDEALSSVTKGIQKTVNDILTQDNKKRWNEGMGNVQ